MISHDDSVQDEYGEYGEYGECGECVREIDGAIPWL